MVKILVTTRDGEIRTVEADEGRSLMEVLRGADVDVLGTCGGMNSCGSCHIYAGNQILEYSSAVSEDEQDMLDALSEVIEVRPCSRLACQIQVTADMDQAPLEIGPQL